MQLQTWMFDAVIVGVAAEFGLLALLLARAGLREWIWPLFWFLLSGALLMASVRSALSGVPHPVIGTVLFISLLTHVACLLSAWRNIRPPV